MVFSDDAPVNHLVVDMMGFVKRAPILKMGKTTYTLAGVISEIRDKATREYVTNSPFELVMREPTDESIKIVSEVAKKTGDYASLSATDLKVLALVHDLHAQHCGRDSINYDVRAPKVVETFEKAHSPALETRIGFVGDERKARTRNQSTNCSEASSQKIGGDEGRSGVDDEDAADTGGREGVDEDPADEDEEEVEDFEEGSDEGEWISQENFDDALLKFNAGAVRPEHADAAGAKREDGKIEVACLTTDFSVQNVLKHMKLNILSLDGLVIKELRSYILRCRSCFHTTSVMTKEFCPRCGNKSLQRVGVSVDADGATRLHIDVERLRVTRGLKHSAARPKGGKHDVTEKLFEDQRIPHNRMARMKNANSDASPFVLNDVYSRSAHLGVRAICGGGRSRRSKNPNENAGGRRKK